MIKAYEEAPAATVVPFSYVNLLWATLFGYILFSDLPDLWTVSGACIIAGSGLYIFHREHMLGKDDTKTETIS
jgi:drug/metabolite transporter (DMT)-like permease